LYLPVALLHACRESHVDLALVIDASTSMGETSGGGRKIDGASEAAALLLDQLDFPRDQAAVVIFHNRSVLLQALTSDRAALDTALDSIALESESRLDLGVIEAREELLGPNARAANKPAMVVLTDGRANPVPASVAVQEAAAAKAAGVTIFTVAIGDEVDTEALRAMASTPAHFYAAASAAALLMIYDQIGRSIPCGLGP
jgi:Mg-chelatase subunit ChlD